MSTSLQKISLQESLMSGKEKLATLLGNTINPDKFINSVLLTVSKTENLQKCTPESILEACYDSATLGLAIDARNLAYLVPYGSKAKLIPSYKGLVELALKSQVVVNIFAEVVYENDKFKYEAGTLQTIEHVPVAMNKPRGNIIGAYAVARFANGIVQPCVMRIDDILKVKNKSRSSGSGPWVTDFDEMAKKTVLKRLCKLLPSNVIPSEAYELDEADFNDKGKVNTGEHPVIEAEIIQTEEQKTNTEATDDRKKSDTPSESDFREIICKRLAAVGEIYSILVGSQPLTLEQINTKYANKSLDALKKILDQTEEKAKAVIIQHLITAQQDEQELDLTVPEAELIKDATEATRFDIKTLWRMYIASHDRIDKSNDEKDSENGALTYEENKSLGR